MKAMKLLACSVSVLAAGIATGSISGIANAASGTSAYVKSVSVDFPGFAAVVDVENISANKNVNAVSLKVQDSEMVFTLSGSVTCAKGNKIKHTGNRAYFGPVGMGGLDNINSSGTLHSETNLDVAEHKEGNNDPVQWTSDTFEVPLNKVKNGHPAVRVDPLEELSKKLQAHLQGGGTKLDFYRNDQEVVIHRPISLAGYCAKDGLAKAGFHTKSHTIQIKYKGDPEVTNKVLLNAQLNGNLPNQINQELPFQLSQATFQPNMPHHIGKCAPNEDPTIRVNYNGSGAGWVRFMIEDAGNPVFGSSNLLYVSDKNFQAHLDFKYPLIAKLAQQQDWGTINKTFNHSLKIRAQVKDKMSNTWGSWKDYGVATWKHRCTPQVAVQIGGQNKAYQDQTPSKPIIVSPIQAIKTKPVRKIDQVKRKESRVIAD